MNDLIQSLTDEIFLAEGGVDDFDSLTHDQLLVIIQRELPRALAAHVLECAIEMQDVIHINRNNQEAL